MIEVSGCVGECARCNGFYEFDRMHNERPAFVNKESSGMFYWVPERDGGIWALNAFCADTDTGYNFSQAPSESRPGLPPTGSWKTERFETNFGSEYPTVKITHKIRKEMADVGGVVVKVSGCSGELADCNGRYVYDRMHNRKPMFVNTATQKGVLYYIAERDGGVWALYAKGVDPVGGYNFSQSPDPLNPSVPPQGQWRFQRFESNCGSSYPSIQALSQVGRMDSPVFSPRRAASPCSTKASIRMRSPRSSSRNVSPLDSPRSTSTLSPRTFTRRPKEGSAIFGNKPGTPSTPSILSSPRRLGCLPSSATSLLSEPTGGAGEDESGFSEMLSATPGAEDPELALDSSSVTLSRSAERPLWEPKPLVLPPSPPSSPRSPRTPTTSDTQSRSRTCRPRTTPTARAPPGNVAVSSYSPPASTGGLLRSRTVGARSTTGIPSSKHPCHGEWRPRLRLGTNRVPKTDESC